MKKIILILFTAVLGLSFTSCMNNGAKTVVEVLVTKSNTPQAGVSVFMFDENSWNTSTSFRTPFFADRTVITDGAGIATFELVGIELELIESQTTFYFATFADGSDNMTGQAAITIRKGETKQTTIQL